jgi:hypothetical protein
MAGSSRPSFTKRLKERARQEKRAEKAQKKAQRKLQKEETIPSENGANSVITGANPVIRYDEDGQPTALDFNDF